MDKKELRKLPKLVVLLGSTASGKTEWSLKLAKIFNGDIISADSRQIFRKMNIGTAKVEGGWRRNGLRRSYFVGDIVHHLVDFLDPGKAFTVAEFRDKAIKYVKLAVKQNKLPMMVGGTGLYISSVVDNFSIPRVAPNNKLRKSLSTKSNEDLMVLLTTLDPVAADVIDRNNKRRIVRALEVSILTGEPFSGQKMKGEPMFDVLQIGISVDRGVLHERIEKRIDKMIEGGLLDEIKGLLKQKYHWDLPSMSGIGYKQFKGFLEGEYDLEEAKRLLVRDTKRYAKRQLTWFRRDKRIKWVRNYEEVEVLIREFLKK
ncbi:MAG: tRNA (adenosine(37)-N6)-dimethylallyltransferase MiaA [Candidatus Magasanikbacteria bacterium]|nr:tRNA (adenosine(37)-N6)-dimethylallyltransferase MiaA [Candidatus Magasanikbacteria bacterium]